jgi:glutathione synthase
MKRLEVLFLMDPLERIDVHKDTTYVIMREAENREHNIYHMLPGDLYLDAGRVMGRISKVTFNAGKDGNDNEKWFCLGEPEDVDLSTMDVMFLREDPPFDMDYLYSTYLTGFIEREVFIVNSPRGIREANEKLYALNFPSIIPEYMVSSDLKRLKGFMVSVGGTMVVKPLDCCGGSGVFVVHSEDRNMNAVIETVTAHGTKQILAQRYIPEIREGDKRLIVLNGEAIGAVLRVPSADEHRANIHVGATCLKVEVTERDREIVRTVAERFAADGIYFAGLDIIGGLVSEINVTSPTGVQEINSLDNVRLEEKVIDFIEQRAPQFSTFR